MEVGLCVPASEALEGNQSQLETSSSRDLLGLSPCPKFEQR